MKFMLAIDLDGDVFDPDPCPELARLLREIARHMDANGKPQGQIVLRDSNGKYVGTCELTRD